MDKPDWEEIAPYSHNTKVYVGQWESISHQWCLVQIVGDPSWRYITLSAPVLYITSTLDPIESLSDTAQGLGYPQVPRGREVVQLLKYFGSMCFREYELF